MTRLTTSDFHPDLIALYDSYAHGQITRGEFLDRAGPHAVGGMTALALLTLMSPNYALARQVAPDDPDIVARRITYPSPNGHGAVNGYLVCPSGGHGLRPAVVVVHENRGLNPYIEDVARRLAKAGFLALAPDGLTCLGGYPGNDERGREMQQSLDATRLTNDFLAAIDFLATCEGSTGRVGIVGFCHGGGIANAAAVARPDLGAAVAFYGPQPDAADVAKIRAPLLLHYGALDGRINAGWPAYEAALKAAGTTYEACIYPGANHGFHNNTILRHDETAARLAWDRTIAFFKAHLE